MKLIIQVPAYNEEATIGRTLADLIRGTRSELTILPWVNQHSRDWEPEPLRLLAINALTRALALDLGAENIRVNTLCPMGGMSANFMLPEGSPLGVPYGDVLGIDRAQVVLVGAVTLAATAVVFLAYRPLLFATFDPETRADGQQVIEPLRHAFQRHAGLQRPGGDVAPARLFQVIDLSSSSAAYGRRVHAGRDLLAVQAMRRGGFWQVTKPSKRPTAVIQTVQSPYRVLNQKAVARGDSGRYRCTERHSTRKPGRRTTWPLRPRPPARPRPAGT